MFCISDTLLIVHDFADFVVAKGDGVALLRLPGWVGERLRHKILFICLLLSLASRSA